MIFYKQFLFFKIVAVVGGMAPQKQQRLLNKCPEIIVAALGKTVGFDFQGKYLMYH